MPEAKKQKRYNPIYSGDVPELIRKLREVLGTEKGVPVGKVDALRIALTEALTARGK